MEFSSARVVVVGGGIIGASIAWRLAQRGHAVSILETGTLGAEASGASAGMLALGGELAPGGEVDQDTQLATLAVESRRLWPHFVHELSEVSGLTIDYQENGAVDLAYSNMEWSQLQKKAKAQRDFGIATQTLCADKVAELWPFVRTDSLAGGVFYPQDGVVNPNQVMAALKVACERSAVHIHEHTSVEGISIGAGSKVQIETAAQPFECEAAVIAAGAWSGLLPVTGTQALPASEPVKGHLVGFEMPDKWCQPIIRHGHIYIFQREGGYLVAGATSERVGFERSIQPAVARQVEDGAGFVLPVLRGRTPSHIWIGFRPKSNALHLGRWQDGPLYLAYGHYRNGILLAPVTGALLSTEIGAALG
jgi:glycine oxidase